MDDDEAEFVGGWLERFEIAVDALEGGELCRVELTEVFRECILEVFRDRFV